MKWHRQLAILGAASLLLGLTGCSGSSANTDPISYTGTALDTVISIKIYDSQDNNLLTKCQKICDDYEATMIPGTPQPVPIRIGMNDLPDKPKRRKILSMMNAIRAI